MACITEGEVWPRPQALFSKTGAWVRGYEGTRVQDSDTYHLKYRSLDGEVCVVYTLWLYTHYIQDMIWIISGCNIPV